MKGTAALAAVGAVASVGFVGGPAQADPTFINALTGVGSDTTQDVLNALAGYAPAGSGIAADGRYPQAIASNGQTLSSFNALNPTAADPCMIPKIGAPTILRPNGSSNGRRALSRGLETPVQGWGSPECGGFKDVTNQLDFARSSSGPSSGDTGTALTYSVLGRDAVSVAFYRTGVAGNTIDPVTSTSSQVKSRWSRAELNQLFSGTGAQTFLADNGTTNVSVLPCGIQLGSGTFSFTRGTYGVSDAQEAAATASCNALGTPDVGRAQENDSTELKQRGDLAPAGTQVVIGFSAGAYIGKSNGVAGPDPQADGVGLAAITGDVVAGGGNNLGLAYSGDAPALAPVESYYLNGVFGRNVYNVVPTSKIDSAFGNQGLKSMFKDPDRTATTDGPLRAAICLEEETIETFGFLVSDTCGSTLLKGSLISGQTNT